MDMFELTWPTKSKLCIGTRVTIKPLSPSKDNNCVRKFEGLSGDIITLPQDKTYRSKYYEVEFDMSHGWKEKGLFLAKELDVSI